MDHFFLDDIKFGVNKVFGTKSSIQEVQILKPKSLLDLYQKQFPENISNILELGIYEGGSVLAFAKLFPDVDIYALDIRDKAYIDDIVNHYGLNDRIHLFHNTSQVDNTALCNIIENKMSSHPDVVLDDCSHFYEETKKSFEIIFPYLNNGGLYIIEDWNWSHAPKYQTDKWLDKPALTNFVFEIIALQGSSALIESIEIIGHSVFIRKSSNCPLLGNKFSVDKYLKLRGKPLTLI